MACSMYRRVKKLYKKIMNEEPIKEEELTAEEKAAQQNEEATQEQHATEEPKELTVEEKLAAAEAQVEELNTKLLYKAAEFDNYRRRCIKEKTELVLNGGEKTIKAILPVIDDMERALKNTVGNEETKAVLEGVDLIYKKFLGILEKEGVKPIDTANADFNVDFHEAIAQLPAPTDELKGKVLDCTLTGYTLNEKVIRHAQVVVAI